MSYYVIVDYKYSGIQVFDFYSSTHAKSFYDKIVNRGGGPVLSVALLDGSDAPYMDVIEHYEWRETK